MTMTTISAATRGYTNKANAVRAARNAGLDPQQFDFIQGPNGWAWTRKHRESGALQPVGMIERRATA